MNSDTYRTIIEYSINKCNIFSLQKYETKFEKIQTKFENICCVIFSDSEFSENFVFDNFSEQLLNQIYEKYKNNEQIYKIEEEYLESSLRELKAKYSDNSKILVPDMEQCIYEAIKASIRYSLEMFIYNKSYDKFKMLYNKYNISKNYLKEIKTEFFTTYFFKLNSSTKNILFSKNTIYDWIFPLNLEDLCLYKDNKIWLYSVAHERICNIYCESEEEYDYLKSIGVEFYEDHYIPIDKEKLYYENYEI